jgi:hypothetical protein
MGPAGPVQLAAEVIEVYYDETIPLGTIEIDGVNVTVEELQAAVAAAAAAEGR